jgi:hypothetical protein
MITISFDQFASGSLSANITKISRVRIKGDPEGRKLGVVHVLIPKPLPHSVSKGTLWTKILIKFSPNWRSKNEKRPWAGRKPCKGKLFFCKPLF